jgi:hypothetical protein
MPVQSPASPEAKRPSRRPEAALVRSINDTTAPGTLLSGATLSAVVSSRMMSASLPGVSEPVLPSSLRCLFVVKERLIGHRFQNPCDGIRNARLKREDAFSHAMIIVSSAMVSSL